MSECERVRQATEAVGQDDWIRVGELMNQSGFSSATDYDISHPQVEVLVQECRGVNGVRGARMMGGGQGGSVLVLANPTRSNHSRPNWIASISKNSGMPPRPSDICPARLLRGRPGRDGLGVVSRYQRVLLLALDVANTGAAIAVGRGQVATGFGIEDQDRAFQAGSRGFPGDRIAGISRRPR